MRPFAIGPAQFDFTCRARVNRQGLVITGIIGNLNDAGAAQPVQRVLNFARRGNLHDRFQFIVKGFATVVLAAAHVRAKTVMKCHQRRSGLRIAKCDPAQHGVD